MANQRKKRILYSRNIKGPENIFQYRKVRRDLFCFFSTVKYSDIKIFFSKSTEETRHHYKPSQWQHFTPVNN